MTHATGIGSWPGTDPVDAARIVLDALADNGMPHLPELPARGPGADLIGRTAGQLVDLAVDLQPSGWRLVPRPGRDVRRARGMLDQDLEVFAEAAQGWTGPVKLQLCGPWTLAASLWLPRGERAATDAGACRDLAASLTETALAHVAGVRRLMPGCPVVLQLDEPSLPAVLGGRLPTVSGFGHLDPVEEPLVRAALTAVVQALQHADVFVAIHCCADEVPLATLRATGANALAVEVARLSPADWEGIAVAVESGTTVWAGAVAPLGGRSDVATIADAVTVPWHRLGLTPASLRDVVVTPACGLAGATPDGARSALRTARDVAAELVQRSDP